MLDAFFSFKEPFESKSLVVARRLSSTEINRAVKL